MKLRRVRMFSFGGMVSNTAGRTSCFFSEGKKQAGAKHTLLRRGASGGT